MYQMLEVDNCEDVKFSIWPPSAILNTNLCLNDMEMFEQCQKWILQVKISQSTCITCKKWDYFNFLLFQDGHQPPFWIKKVCLNDMEMLKRCQKWILQVKISQFTCIICFKWTILKMSIFQYGRHPPSWISPNKHIFFDHTRRFWVIGVMYYPKTPKLFGWKKFPRPVPQPLD